MIVMLLNLTELSSRTLDEQIVEQLTDKIIMGELPEGTPVVPYKRLARLQHVSVTSAKQAYDQLADLGLIENQRGDEYRVAALTNQLLTALRVSKYYAKATARRRLDEAVRTARELRNALLPEMLPLDRRFQIAATCQAAWEVGGDFYDCFPIDADRYGLVVADACGDGLPAAMLISQLHAIVKSLIGEPIAKTTAAINQHLKCHTPAQTFVTFFFGVLDARNGEFEFVNAGHNYPMVISDNGSCRYLETTGPALGIRTDPAFATTRSCLADHDLLVCYTDGISESKDSDEEEYGDNRFRNALVAHRRHTPDVIIATILHDLDLFRAGKAACDDRTLMVLKMNGKEMACS